MSQKIIREEVRKAEDSFAKLEGHMQAAIDEMFPSHSAYGPIEGMLVYQPPEGNDAHRETRLIRSLLDDTRDQLREIMYSLRDARSDFVGIYQEGNDVKDTD